MSDFFDRGELEYKDTLDLFPTQNREIVIPERDYNPMSFSDSDDKRLVQWSTDEFKRLISALIVGAEICYPDASHEVLFSFIREVDYPLSLCEEIAHCIENSETVKAALKQVIIELGFPNPKGTSGGLGTGVGAENVLENSSCDLAEIYGACVAIVDYVHAVSSQLIAIVASETSDSLRIARIIDFIPILGDLPLADDLNDLVSWIVLDVYVDFDAGYSVDLRQDLICYMFNAACADCNLSPYEIISAYAANGGFPLNINDTFEMFLTYIVGLTVEQALACAIMGMVAAALANGSEVLGLVGLQGLKTIAASGEPDEDYLLFCDPCNDDILLDITVNYDALGYPHYTTSVFSTTGHSVSGGVTSGGNPDNCLYGIRSGINFNANITLKTIIDLQADYTINTITLDAWCYSNPLSNNLASYNVFFEFKDSLGNTLYTTSIQRFNVAHSTWLNESGLSGLNVANVRTITINMGGSSSGAVARSGTFKIDNIRIQGIG